MIPFAAADLALVLICQIRVALEQLAHARRHVVRRHTPLARVQAIEAGRHVHVEGIGGRADGILHELEVGVAHVRGQRAADAHGFVGERIVVRDDTRRLIVVGEAVGVGLKLLRAPPRVVARVFIDDGRDVLRVRRTEFARSPITQVLGQPLRRPRLRIPRIRHEEFGRHFHRLQVAHVDDPQPVRAVLVREIHLLPHLGDLGDIQPFVRTWAADVVEVVVDAGAAAALAFLKRRQTADIAPVIVAPEQQHVVRDAHALLVVVLNFLVQRPQLRHLLRFLLELLPDDRTLVADDLLQQVDVGVFRHRLVAVAAHRHRDHLFVIARVAQALGPEVTQDVAVAMVIPRSLAVALPLLLRPHHRFVVGRAHHDAHRVGELAVFLVVVIERRVPHGRPQVVGAHAEH